MFRGETYIIFLNSILLHRFTILLKNSFKWVYVDYIVFGTCIGLLALSRQWSFLLFPPYFLIYILLKIVNACARTKQGFQYTPNVITCYVEAVNRVVNSLQKFPENCVTLYMSRRSSRKALFTIVSGPANVPILHQPRN